MERALRADPGYPMAHLLAEGLAAALPPRFARPPMTPEELAAAYDRAGGGAGHRRRRKAVHSTGEEP